MSRQSREAKRLLQANAGSDPMGLDKPRHLLDVGNKPPPQPYMPRTLFREHNQEARRRLKQSVRREIKAMDEEIGIRATLDGMVRSLPQVEGAAAPVLMVSAEFARNRVYMRVAEEMALTVKVAERIPAGHVQIGLRADETGK